jgi:hypothetical protein
VDEVRVEIDGDVVRRPRYPWSAGVHALLAHLAAVGFDTAPRYLGDDAQGREQLTYLPGASGADSWAQVVPESGLVAMAQLLRRYHDAVAGYRPAGPWAGTDAPMGPDDVVCHGDFGPWNLVWVDGSPVGVLDWDLAWPQPARFDLCYALEYVAPFRDDPQCVRWLAYDAPPDRRHRIAVFAAAYGLTVTPGLVDELVDGVIAQQRLVRERMATLADQGIEPQVTWVAAGQLAELDRRIGWSERYRDSGGTETSASGPTAAPR